MKQKKENGGVQNSRFIFTGVGGAETGRDAGWGWIMFCPTDRDCHGRKHHYQRNPLNQRHTEVKNGLQSEV